MSERKHSMRTMSPVSGVLACAVACATSPSSHITTAPAAAEASRVAAGVPNLYDAQRQVEQYIASGRYEEDVASMGDQQSDLTGGYAERTFKLPNPVYFLP
jgi:hypothetical protein